MNGDVNFAHKANRQVLELACSYQKELEKTLPNLFGVSSSEIARRITQIFVKNKYPALLKKISNNEELSFPVGEKIPFFSKLKIFFKIFVHHSIYLLWSVLGSFNYFLLKPRAKIKVFLGPGIENYLTGDIKKEFYQFCLRGHLKVLDPKQSTLIVQWVSRRTAKYKGVYFSLRPYLTMARVSGLSPLRLLTILIVSIQTLIQFWQVLNKFPVLIHLYTDLFRFPMIKVLNDATKIDSIIMTNSSFYDQEFWLNGIDEKNFRTIFVWYSVNTRAFKYKKNTSFCEHPSYEFVIADESYTWNEGHAKWLDKNTRIRSNYPGAPITYQLPSEKRVIQDIDILIFDVTPVNREWIDTNISPNFYNYFHASNMKKFVADIMSAGEAVSGGGELCIAIKPKREYDSIHDKEYISYIKSLGRDRLKIISSNENAFDLARRAKVLVVIPFSSPAFIGSYMNVKSAYYDPEGSLLSPEDLDSNISFLSSKDELEDYLKKNLV